MTAASLWTALYLAVATAAATGPGADYDWGVACYLPYDNDLGGYYPTILGELRAGLDTDRVAVATLADLPNDQGLHRVELVRGAERETVIAGDNSADPEQLLAFLTWFAGRYRCRRYVVALLDHGGRVGESCLDEHPGTGPAAWLPAAELGRVLRTFRGWTDGQWELLFLQQCGRASLEDSYALRGTARCLLASAVPVGVPNSYYRTLLHHLGQHPEASGFELAATIAAADRNYTTYVALRGELLGELPARINELVTSVETLGPAPAWVSPRSIYRYADERAADAVVTLRRLAGPGGQPAAVRLEQWLTGRLTEHVYRRDAPPADESAAAAPPWVPCGMSMFVPRSRQQLAGWLTQDLMRGSRLARLWLRVLPPE